MASSGDGRSAAFFDLDRTLLSGGSGQVFSEAMRSAGLIGRSIPGERMMYGLFSRVGENLPSMMLARQAATLAKGRSRRSVQAAAQAAADVLVGMIQPFAGPVIEQHKAAGRRLVMATTTPVDLVRPLAERLGFDDVVATTYGVNADGTYDGTIVGPFVWANGKLEAVREWAARHDIDMGDSYAYSDSVYDTPLLSAVGHPVAVNPDPRMLLMALSPALARPPPRRPTRRAQAARCSTSSHSRWRWPSPDRRRCPYARWDIPGVEHIPAAGPVILVANHRSYFDALAMTLVIARSGRTARFLGKKEVFDVPVLGQLAKAMGGIRVERASGSDEPLRFAAEALEAGQMVALDAPGHHPPGAELLRPGAQGEVGRRPPRGHDQGARGAGRPVGHREGVATLLPPAPHLERHRPAAGPGAGGTAG